ncbi:MAG: LysE family translocator [Alphaproteobacteria bacterium]
MLENLGFFPKGFMLGFAIAAPVGPIGMLCIRRTLAHGMASGLATGTGAAFADAFYGAVAAFGLTAISDFLINYKTPMQFLGGLFLVYLGVKTFMQKPRENTGKDEEKGRRSVKQLAGELGSTFLLTVANPATIISFIGFFTGLGLLSGAAPPAYSDSALMVAGVFIGSFAWWCILSGGIAAVRHGLGPKAIKIANLLSAAIIGGFGVLALVSLI